MIFGPAPTFLMLNTDASLQRISGAVDQLLLVLDQEIERTASALKTTPTVPGQEAAQALDQCLRFALFREQARAFLGQPVRLPEGFSLVLSSPAPKPQAEPAQPAKQFALTRVETAKALGVSPITVDRLVLRGLLRPSRATRRPLFAPTEIERFMRETSRAISP